MFRSVVDMSVNDISAGDTIMTETAGKKFHLADWSRLLWRGKVFGDKFADA